MSDIGIPTSTPGEYLLPSNRTTYGPPIIDVILMNIDPTSDFRTIRKPWYGTLAQILAEIARAAEKDVYKIVSLNTSAYSVVAVVQTVRSGREVRGAHPRNVPVGDEVEG